MKKFLILAFALLMLSARLPAQNTVTATLSAAGSNCLITNVCQALPTPNMGSVTFTVSANASSNTIQFEGTANGGITWVALDATPSNSTTPASSTTSTGTWQANIGSYTAVRMRMSTKVGGTTTVTITTSAISARASGANGITGTITDCTTTGGVAYENGTSNTLACGADMSFDPTKNFLTLLNPANGPANGDQSSLNLHPLIVGSGGISTFFSNTPMLDRSGYACIQNTASAATDACIDVQDDMENFIFNLVNDGEVYMHPLVAPGQASITHQALFEINPDSGITFIDPIKDVQYKSTASAWGGVDVVRGIGLGSDSIFSPSLRETVQQSAAESANVVRSVAAGAAAFAYYMNDTGEFILINSPDGMSVFSQIAFEADGSIDLSPDASAPNVHVDGSMTANTVVRANSGFSANGTAGISGSTLCSATIAYTEGLVTACTAVSDPQLKVFGSYSRGLDAIMQIKPIHFHWNKVGLQAVNLSSKFNPEQIGFSAKNIQQAIPEAVGYERHGDVDYLSLPEGDRPIVAALVNAVQQQQKEIEGLKADIAKLKAAH